jgi:hypothetical protein
MKITTKFKIIFDTSLFLLFILDYNTMMRSIGGMYWHEISGLVFAGLLIIHMVIDWGWIKNVTINIFRSKLPSKSRVQYWNDTILFLLTVYILVSGIGCSDILFPNYKFGNQLFMKHSHKIVSFVALVSLGVHLGLSWKWVIYNLKKMLRITATSNAARVFWKTGAVVVLVVGTYFGTTAGFYTRIFHINQFYDKTYEYPMVGLNKDVFSYNPLFIILVWTSITAVFVVLTYYLEQYISESKTRRTSVKATAEIN